MYSESENRQWLTWLVKVRILVLTVLLGVELAIAQFTPVAFPIRLFVDAVLLAYTIAAVHLGAGPMSSPGWRSYFTPR
jgi:hypothetical protein